MSLADNQKIQGVVERARNIIVQPNEEWTKIEGETATLEGLLKNYVAYLAAIPAICGLIGSVLFGYGVFRLSLGGSLLTAIASYVMSFVTVVILGLVIDWLAPTFKSTKNQIQAFKLASYSLTASWAVGVFMLIPSVGAIAALAGLYSLYVFYLGLPKLMKTPQDSAISYTVVVIVVAGVLLAITQIAIHSITGPSLAMTSPSLVRTSEQNISSPLQMLAKSNENIAAIANASKQEAVQPIAPDSLKNLLPESLDGGFARTEISSMAPTQIANTSTAEGIYVHDAAEIKISISDIGGMPQLVGMMGMLNIQSSKETPDSYSKSENADGRMTTEEFNKTTNHGSYSVFVAKRFMVRVEGTGVDMSSLKSTAKNFISPLESMSR